MTGPGGRVDFAWDWSASATVRCSNCGPERVASASIVTAVVSDRYLKRCYEDGASTTFTKARLSAIAEQGGACSGVHSIRTKTIVQNVHRVPVEHRNPQIIPNESG